MLNHSCWQNNLTYLLLFVPNTLGGLKLPLVPFRRKSKYLDSFIGAYCCPYSHIIGLGVNLRASSNYESGYWRLSNMYKYKHLCFVYYVTQCCFIKYPVSRSNKFYSTYDFWVIVFHGSINPMFCLELFCHQFKIVKLPFSILSFGLTTIRFLCLRRILI